MSFLYLKSLHIIFIITWFAGLFYIPRLFIYHVEAMERPEAELKILGPQFQVMEWRLWYIITWPSAILTLILGPLVALDFWPWTDNPWLIAKLFFVFLLYLYHLKCHYLFKELQKGLKPMSSQKLRMWNEVSTLLLFIIIFLVIFKNLLSIIPALIGLISLAASMMIAIKLYRRKREAK